MLRTREDLEELEARTLAPYAMLARNTRGRRVEEPPHPMRTTFQRDRDRIIHSAAFRRLEYKTQVFLNGTGDLETVRLLLGHAKIESTAHYLRIAKKSDPIAISRAFDI